MHHELVEVVDRLDTVAGGTHCVRGLGGQFTLRNVSMRADLVTLVAETGTAPE